MPPGVEHARGRGQAVYMLGDAAEASRWNAKAAKCAARPWTRVGRFCSMRSSCALAVPEARRPDHYVTLGLHE